jgi:hypothetical protein
MNQEANVRGTTILRLIRDHWDEGRRKAFHLFRTQRILMHNKADKVWGTEAQQSWDVGRSLR